MHKSAQCAKPGKIHTILTSVKVLGLWMVVVTISLRVVEKIYNLLKKLANRVKSHDPFDHKYGTDTAGELQIKDANVPDSQTKSGAQLYWATPERIDRYLLNSLEIEYSQYTFIDFGSGKGRVLLVASSYPFRQIIGVEFVPELHEIAENNIRHYKAPDQKCQSISSVCMDATKFTLPKTPLVLHFYHPFKSQSDILAQVIGRIDQSLTANPRPVWIVYVHHVDDAVGETFSKFPSLRKHRDIKLVDAYWNTTIYTNNAG